MKLSRDLAAGVANSAWSALVNLAAVPLYVRYLGIESYGLIGFMVTVQAMLQLLDMGLSATMNREIARCYGSGSLAKASGLLSTLAVVYWVTAGCVVMLSVVAGPLLSIHWLGASHLPLSTLESSVTLLGVVVACRWPVGLYQGVLLGAHKLALASGINMVMTTLGSVGAIAILALVSPTIQAFFLWQAVTALVYAATIRSFAWRAIGTPLAGNRFNFNELKSIWRVTAGMSSVALSAVLLMQADKLILSKVLTLESFGRYMLATVVASGLNLILTPTFNLVFPRLSALLVKGDQGQLATYYRRGTRLLASALFPLSALIIFFARELLEVWTGDAAVAATVAPLLQLFLVGSTMNGFMHFPYALQLASAQARTTLSVNVALILITLPTTTFLALHFGALGGAVSWVVMNACYVGLGTWLTHRRTLPGMGLRWLISDVGAPLAATTMVLGLTFWWLRQLELPRSLLLSIALLAATLMGMALFRREQLYDRRLAQSPG